MSKISSVLDISKRSLMNSQNALQTVSHNVASKNIEGYSRQRIETEATPSESFGGVQLGTGARTKAVTRVVNEYLEKQLELEGGRLGTREGESENLARVENLFNDQLRKGLNQFVTEFFNSFRELANSPDNQATRELVAQTASAVMEDLGNMHRQLRAIQEDIDGQAKAQVSVINTLIRELAQMNEKVEQIEFTGVAANDERDRRDQILKELGQKINIKYTEGENGKVVVTAGKTAVIVSGGEHAILETSPTAEYKNKREGNVDIFFRNEHTTPVVITDQINGGRLGGSLVVRDEVINELLAKIDNLAYNIAEKVNMAHRRGFDRYGNTGVDMFEMPTEMRDAAANIKLNEAIKEDVWRIAAAGMPDAPGDNRVANLMASLQTEKWMDNGQSTFNDYYNGVVSEMAVKIRHSNDMRDYQANIVEQLKNVRENISGVNLDEEMVKMIEYQKAFDASARLIRTADEMLDTVLNIKR